MVKACANCKYNLRRENEEPCNKCGGTTFYWEKDKLASCAPVNSCRSCRYTMGQIECNGCIDILDRPISYKNWKPEASGAVIPAKLMNTTFNEYQQLAARTINPKLREFDQIVNGLMGCSGEAGEALDIMKKHMFQGHNLDNEAIIKELGDQLWYIAETATGLGVELSEIASKNIEKLIKRYPDGFSKERSVNRDES